MSTLRKDHIQIGQEEIPVQNWCETQLQIQKVNFVWVIHNYHFYKTNMKKGEKLKSQLFSNTSSDRCKWFLALDPNGYVDNYMHSSSFLYAYLDSTSECTRAMGKIKISFLDESQKERSIISQDHQVWEFKTKTENGKFWCSFQNDEILQREDTLRIYCEISFSEVDPLTHTFIQFNSIQPHTEVSELRMVEDIKQLLNNEEFTDIEVATKGKNFKAHKTILIARSPVFATMLKHENMKETRQNKIDILDFDDVVEEMINYIYTGKSENLKTLAADLLAIAEKYGLDGLKNISENALVEILSEENAIDLLLLADLHGACKLKTNAINFIVSKYTKLMKTTAWKNIAVSHPQLLLEVCEILSGQLNRQHVLKNL